MLDSAKKCNTMQDSTMQYNTINLTANYILSIWYLPDGFSTGTGTMTEVPIMHSIRSNTVGIAGVAVKFNLYQNWPIFGFEKLIFPENVPACRGE